MTSRGISFSALLVAALGWCDAAHAQVGGLDPGFDGDGLVKTDIGAQENGFDVVVQPDGKIVVAGTRTDLGAGALDFTVARYLSNGALDATFGFLGIVLTDLSGGIDQGEAVALQADGKILVAGARTVAGAPQNSNDVAIVRYHPNGAIDASFGIAGVTLLDLGSTTQLSQGEGYGLAVQPDGKIVFAGQTRNVSNNDRRFLVLRLQASGFPDFGFGVQGRSTISLAGALPPAMALQSDGRIVLAGGAFVFGGPNFALVRFTANGSFDPSFGLGGLVVTDLGGSDRANGVTLQPDGKIVAAGRSGGDFGLVRYLSNGALDGSFGAGGIVVTNTGGSDDVAEDVLVEPSGRIVVAGHQGQVAHPDFLLARYRADGSLDGTFGTGGLVTTGFAAMTGDKCRSMARQANGRIVLAGTSTVFGNPTGQDLAVARYCAGLAPYELIAAHIDFFDQAVAAGSLHGTGHIPFAHYRLGLMRIALDLAGQLAELGEVDIADRVLLDAFLRSDGESHPRDYVAGGAAPQLAAGILEARFALVDVCNQ